ncbi:MAG TPA: efflux RND transporter permease subunit, partial [Candidatus Cloacimonadota bacterium]|nr:efflux RND transporter permease subunit [Candidatus Cloacimonadota bacterium]
MRLPKIAVNKPVFIIMIFVAIFIFGVVSRIMLPVDVLPDIEYPTLTVLTVYPGVAASDVEKQLTNKLEKVLAGINNLKSIKSSSKENVSLISLEFNWNTDLDEAANDARDAIELVKMKLPDEAKNPIIYKLNSSMLPVLIYAIEADESFNGLYQIIDKKISNRLRKVPGVATVIVIGSPEREIKINIDPHKLSAYNLSIAQIAQILEMENITIPGGSIKIGTSDLAVSIPGEVANVEDIGNIALINVNDEIIRLRDVAEIVDGYKDKDIMARSTGNRAVALAVQKQTGSNTQEVAKLVKEEVDKIREIVPSDIKITQAQDSSELVTGSINNLTSTIIWAALFVLLVVFFFLRKIKNSLIIILTIPFSLIVAFIFMYIGNYTVNIFSLMSLAIAIGMVVDNAIVVFENIIRHIERGSKPQEASVFGASEMGLAITASTLTTVAVFIPMFFIGGLVGIVFKQLAILTSVTLLASLFTSLTLTPMLSSKWLKRDAVLHPKETKLFKFSEKIFNSVENGYA